MQIDNYLPITISIMLQLTRRIPFTQGLVMLIRQNIDVKDFNQNQIIQFWFDQQPKWIIETFKIFLDDLNNKITDGTISLDSRSDMSGFTLGDLSKQFKTNSVAGGGVDWRTVLPAGTMALFNAIPIDWTEQTMVLSSWLRR